jgi:hypothetical protein
MQVPPSILPKYGSNTITKYGRIYSAQGHSKVRLAVCVIQYTAIHNTEVQF